MPKQYTVKHRTADGECKLLLVIGATKLEHKQKMRRRLNLVLQRRRAKYGIGTHGSAKFQRKAMNTDGERHESEHVIGYNVYAESFDRTRGEGKKIELGGLAYLEVKALHRAHPGTGSGGEADAYRTEQRAILEEGRSAAAVQDGPQPKTVSSAIQYNQLEYAHLPDQTTGEDVQIASVSYEAMVRNGASVTYMSNGTQTSFQISQVERAEMLLAYEIRKTGAWPLQDRIAEVLRDCGLQPIVVQDKQTGADIVQ